MDLEGEETERQRRYRESFEARRTTEIWKTEFEWFADFRRDERELEDGSLAQRLRQGRDPSSSQQ